MDLLTLESEPSIECFISTHVVCEVNCLCVSVIVLRALIQLSASAQLLFLGLTPNNTGGGGREGGSSSGQVLAQTKTAAPVASNPISPQTSKSSEAASGHSTVNSCVISGAA